MAREKYQCPVCGRYTLREPHKRGCPMMWESSTFKHVEALLRRLSEMETKLEEERKAGDFVQRELETAKALVRSREEALSKALAWAEEALAGLKAFALGGCDVTIEKGGVLLMELKRGASPSDTKGAHA